MRHGEIGGCGTCCPVDVDVDGDNKSTCGGVKVGFPSGLIVYYLIHFKERQ